MAARTAVKKLFIDAAWTVLDRVPARLLPDGTKARVNLRRHFREALEEDEFGVFDPLETVPPDDERFTVHAVWTVEFYSPRHAGMLIERLREMGFDSSRKGIRDESLSDYIRGRRASIGEAWMNLGVVVPKGHQTWPDRVEMDLPSGVDAGFLSLHHFTPSLSALLTMFILDDTEASRFDGLARRLDFKPTGELRAHSFSVNPSWNVKQDALREQRQRTRELACEWVASNFPGAFTGANQITPSADLVTTEVGTPFQPDSLDGPYLRFADLGYMPAAVWVSDSAPGWKLFTDRQEQFLTIAGRRRDVIEGTDRDSRWQIAQRANLRLDKNLVLWAAVRLLSTSHRRLAHIRDLGGGLTNAHMPIRRLKRIGDEYLRDSLDSRTVAAELGTYAHEPERFSWGASEWSGVELFADEQLVESWRFVMRRMSAALLAGEERVRDGLLVETTLLTAIANLRMQRWFLLLTVVTIALGVIAIVVATGSGSDGQSITL